jgi:hypothetical protein
MLDPIDPDRGQKHGQAVRAQHEHLIDFPVAGSQIHHGTNCPRRTVDALALRSGLDAYCIAERSHAKPAMAIAAHSLNDATGKADLFEGGSRNEIERLGTHETNLHGFDFYGRP